MQSFAPITPVGNEDQVYQFGRNKPQDLLPQLPKDNYGTPEPNAWDVLRSRGGLDFGREK
jgi:hypothetical protein